MSTNTKNAHIPLVSQSNRAIHPVPKDKDLFNCESFNFLPKYSIASFINAKPKNKTKGPDKKFILTATVSGDNQDQENILPILNQNAINECRKNGIALAVHTLPQIIQKFSAITFGTYKYS
ncbi:MAG: hypothetical protein BWY04_00529 [candidate division CPR1 bacterium ADurb.Bin160]|uniref:Uncharacterized protein n=1 Tax=candidate division CPR1 bacterium ADurb.Bin160 TaxID=1852826 RepID=A0A1V5ZPD1_9BACT|nr:MAG: hypothetical protein BWY04_00529 [candidate division CPR1 bacterium ADurb.Bin160]